MFLLSGGESMIYKKEYENTSKRYSLKLNKNTDADILKMLEYHKLIYPSFSMNQLLRDALRNYLRYGYGYNPD